MRSFFDSTAAEDAAAADEDLPDDFAAALADHEASGMLTVEGDWIRTTPDGLLVVDTLLPAFFRPEHISDRYV